MKKYIFAVLCGMLVLSSVVLPSVTYSVDHAEFTQALENKEYYEQGDIVVKVYEIECGDGIGGLTFDVGYDGDNFDLYEVNAADNYNVAYRDNHVGKLTVGLTDSNVIEPSGSNESVKIAVGFKSLYMLDVNYIKFSYKMKSFADGSVKKNNNYTVSESSYVYEESNGVEYEDYIRGVIGIDLDDDTDTESDTDTATDSDSDKNKDTDTSTDKGGNGKDIDTSTDKGGNGKDTDTSTDKGGNGKDTDTSTDKGGNGKDTDTSTDKGSNGKDTDTSTDKGGNGKDTDTNSGKETDTDTDTQKPEKYVYGDVDSDGEITSRDSLLVLRCSVKLENFTQAQIKSGDVDGDGRITSLDSLKILRYSVGLEKSLEIE
ncbi:MAG: hypothetical protein II931_01075 [Clostridia bacterium]|nr:hypothetical protein [Clostridia bacterium]